MKDLTGIPDSEKHKHLNWHVHADPISELAHDASMSLAAETEAVLRSAINTRLGRSDWPLNEIAGRLEVHHPQNKPGVDVYHLDGRLLVEFYPVKSEGSGTQIRMYRQYKIYN